MDTTDKETMDAFNLLYNTIKKLRSPEGCPWDREQSPASLRSSLLEESYECIEAINENDSSHIKEELGDLYLLVTMISYMNEQENNFTVKDALQGITEKLIRRHPHVFAVKDQAISSSEVLVQWDKIKETVEKRPKKDSVLDSVSTSLPVLDRSFKIQKKAAKSGFDWNDEEPVWEKLHEELNELKEEIDKNDFSKAEGEMGDLLFSVINLSRHLKIDPSMALFKTNIKFEKRFKYVEKKMKDDKIDMSQQNLEIMDRLWEESKSLLN